MRFYTRAHVEQVGAEQAQYDGEKARYLSLFWLYVEPDDTAFTPHWRGGHWESWITKWMSEQLETHNHFIDIGSNVGYYTMLALASGVTTMAVEPQSRLVEMINKSAVENGWSDNLYVLHGALSNSEGVHRLIVPSGHSGAAFIERVPVSFLGDFDTEIIQSVPLDYFQPKFNNPVLIKMDAEGSEPLIWAGMQQFIRDNKFTIAMEWAPHRYENPEEFLNLLMQYEVSLIDYDGNEVPAIKADLLSIQEFEMIVIRNFRGD